MKNVIYFFILGAILFLKISCRKQTHFGLSKDNIIAIVGDYNINVNEFKTSFELGFSQLKMGNNPRRAYLNHMINETLLSLEGTRLGYNLNPYVQKRVTQRNYSNLLEAFYMANVHGKVRISEEDIQNAIQKSSVKWRMLIWPTPSLVSGEKSYNAARQSTLVEYVSVQLAKSEFKIESIKDFETDWLDYLDIHPMYLKTISDLEIGKVSKPVPYGDGYALFQILDIHREGVLADELKFGPRRKRIKARLHNIQADSISSALMDSALTPFDVRVKGDVLEDFTDALFQWYNDGLPNKGTIISHVENISGTSKPYLIQINKLLNKTLVSSNQWKKNVRDYLKYMNYYRRILKENIQSIETFRIALITEIGRMVKNDTYTNIAKRDNLGNSDKILNDIKLWTNKWTYDSYRHTIVKELDVTHEEMLTYFKTSWRKLDLADVDTTRFYKYEKDVYNALLFEKHQETLVKKLSDLKNRYPVWINNDLLDTLKLADSYKDIQTSLFVRKSFTGEVAVPTADMQWISF